MVARRGACAGTPAQHQCRSEGLGSISEASWSPARTTPSGSPCRSQAGVDADVGVSTPGVASAMLSASQVLIEVRSKGHPAGKAGPRTEVCSSVSCRSRGSRE